MDKLKKLKAKDISPFIETRSIKYLSEQTKGNLYEAIAIMSKRSNQISVELKEELHSKLEEFASTSDNLEEVFENREQIEISKFYEKLPHATLLATDEFLNDQIYNRNPANEPEEEPDEA